MTWLLEEAERKPVLAAWEDLHWADPSTLEVLSLCIDQASAARMLLLLTFRPDFHPPWAMLSHLTHLMPSRLGREQAEEMIERVTGSKALSAEVIQQVVSKTDGVPLFVEELTKNVVESVGALREAPLQLAIPATLHDALMARLDRLGTVKEIAQLGAVLGREFNYELLRAVWSAEEPALQQGLAALVQAELLYQRRLLPQAYYIFKRALIQDIAYQSLLKRKRQQYHQQIAQVLEGRFSEIKETQPELLAHHYTEAGLIEQAIPYWQQAGQRAVERSANTEAISHLTKGLELLQTLPDTPERVQQELTLQIALGVPLIATKGFAAPEVERTYARALDLCRQVGETPHLFLVRGGLWRFHLLRAELRTARELAEQDLRLAQSMQDSVFLLGTYSGLAFIFYQGEFALAREYSEKGIALYESQQHRFLISRYGQDLQVTFLSSVAWVLWYLGYPDQARRRSTEALTLARELSHPFTLVFALNFTATLHQLLREV